MNRNCILILLFMITGVVVSRSACVLTNIVLVSKFKVFRMRSGVFKSFRKSGCLLAQFGSEEMVGVVTKNWETGLSQPPLLSDSDRLFLLV